MKPLLVQLQQVLLRVRDGIPLRNSRYERCVNAVNAAGEQLTALSDFELQKRAQAIRSKSGARARADRAHRQLAAETVAVAREAASRTLGMRPYDVQILAAFALQQGRCVEMQTGEGKTLAAAMTCCLRALSGQAVHVLTFNDYLAARDAKWMEPLFQFLGLTAGSVEQGMSAPDRQRAYASDITYVTAREAGFDFLRDQALQDPSESVHRGFNFAIVDEADSILIDEARTPLVIATEAERDDTDLYRVAEIARTMRSGVDYQIREHGRNVSFTDSALERLERQLQCGELHSERNIDLLTRLNLSLQAEVLLKRDVDYIVRDEAIELIDDFTGRVAENRRWPGGLQAAIEAKEGLQIQPQGRILNSITLQCFLELYDGIAGMTGTAQVSADELKEFYDLKTVVVEPNRPCIRRDHDDRIYTTKSAKYEAIAREVAVEHQRGRPVLIGTASVDESQKLAQLFRQSRIPCQVLNAINDHQEARIISEAGAVGAVTISTNMAGRGTDICLGGSNGTQRSEVVALGGLYVIGTNRHESRRIDNQLRGRAGRQGDPGESRFFISIEDDLIRRFGIASLVADLVDGSDSVIDDPHVSKQIAHIQRVIEGESFEIRRTLRKYAFLLERQRRNLFQYRDQVFSRRLVPHALRDHSPEFFQQLKLKFSEEVVTEAERCVTLRHLDRCWSDHLVHAAEIREGIHLYSMGGFNAFDAFNQQMNREYRTLMQRVREEVVKTMTEATMTSRGIDLDAEGLSAPSSTWTFMINDNPRGGVLDQLTKGLWRMITRQKR